MMSINAIRSIGRNCITPYALRSPWPWLSDQYQYPTEATPARTNGHSMTRPPCAEIRSWTTIEKSAIKAIVIGIRSQTSAGVEGE